MNARLLAATFVAGWLILLSGCTTAPGGDAAWLGAAAAALAVALGFALGSARTRLRTEKALREARSQARQLASLQEGHGWQTDAACHLLGWPVGAGEPAAAAPLFQAPALLQRLHEKQAFSGLRVVLPQPVAGSRAWLLSGVPRQDDLGGFAGFAGHARALDEDDALALCAAALPALLSLQAGPALLALDKGQGWTLWQANAAASAQWPGLQAGAALPAALAGLPAALAGAFDAPPDAGAEIAADGWRLLPCAPLAGGRRALLLGRQAKGGGAEAPTASESDSFSFTVSHDLRAPIRVVEGFTRIVKEDYGRLLDRVGNDHLDRVLGAAARMNLMIDALLTLARLSSQPLARQPVNLSQLAAYVVDDLRRSAPERSAEVEIEPGLATQGDPTLLRLVLENLLGNAWKYSARCPKARIALQSVSHDGRRAYVVRDNGAGFDMRSSERLFGLFQRLHSASEFPGHGVGLASVRRIVHRHGGDIWAEAEPGRGAAFYFTLAA